MRNGVEVRQIGFLGASPELRYTPGGKAVATFRVATTRRWKDRETKEQKESTTWILWQIWGVPAENLAKLAQKGAQIYLEGELRNHSWKDEKSGETRYRDDHVTTYWKLLDRKSQDDSAAVEGAGDAPDDDVPV